MRGMFMIRKSRKVAVLGAGPSGLLAAQAAYECGYDPIIFSRGPMANWEDKVIPETISVAKSELNGCQYLHTPGPLALGAGEGHPVDYLLEGTSEGYREKVYGADSLVAVSPDEYGTGEPHMAWDLRQTYDKLWYAWHTRMRIMNLTPAVAMGLMRDDWAAVLVTVPAPSLCYQPAEHNFSAQTIWAMGQMTGGPKLPVECPPFTVVCNGTRDTGWYRKANVFGHTTVEWSRKPPIKGAVMVQKPISTDCDCHLRNLKVHRFGRFGQWKKGVLVHSAYDEVKAMMK